MLKDKFRVNRYHEKTKKTNIEIGVKEILLKYDKECRWDKGYPNERGSYFPFDAEDYKILIIRNILGDLKNLIRDDVKYHCVKL